MCLQRRHYEYIARVMKRVIDVDDRSGDGFGSRRAFRLMAREFDKDMPNFNIGRFLQAAGLDDGSN